MSEHITHVAVYEDTARLIKHTNGQFTKAFHDLLQAAYDSGLFCSGARGNHLYAVPILEKIRELHKQGKFGGLQKEQVAGAIGWLTHRAADLQMKPLFRQLEEENHPLLPDNECQMYHDALSYKEVYKGGRLNTLSPHEYIDETLLSRDMEANPASQHVPLRFMEGLFTHCFLAGMLGQARFVEDVDDINDYTEKIINQSQDLYEACFFYHLYYKRPRY